MVAPPGSNAARSTPDRSARPIKQIDRQGESVQRLQSSATSQSHLSGPRRQEGCPDQADDAPGNDLHVDRAGDI
jgi:hypothetical protein